MPQREEDPDQNWIVVDSGGTVVEASASARRHGFLPSAPWTHGFDERVHPALLTHFGVGWIGVGDTFWPGTRGGHWHLRIHRRPDGARVVLTDVTRAVERSNDHHAERHVRALVDVGGRLARELNDAVSIVLGRLELAVEVGDIDAETLPKQLSVALEHGRQVAAALQNLRSLGQARLERLASVSVAQAVERGLEVLGPRRRAGPIQVQIDPEIHMGGDLEVTSRICSNALHALIDLHGRNRPITVQAEASDAEVRLIFAVGGGDRRAAAPVDAGGFGLTVAAELAQCSGADLSLQRGPGGTTITLRAPPAPTARGRSGAIEAHLLVVGSMDFGEAVSAVVESDGFIPRVVNEACAALAHPDWLDEVEAVAIQAQLPDLRGATLAEAILARAPHLAGHIAVIGGSPSPVSGIHTFAPPLTRTSLLPALGRTVRRRKLAPGTRSR